MTQRLAILLLAAFMNLPLQAAVVNLQQVPISPQFSEWTTS